MCSGFRVLIAAHLLPCLGHQSSLLTARIARPPAALQAVQRQRGREGRAGPAPTSAVLCPCLTYLLPRDARFAARRLYNDSEGKEHVQLQFHMRGPSGRATVNAGAAARRPGSVC